MRIGVIIPVFNEAKYLPLCLKSLLAQTLRPSQVIICDNESTDNTQQVAARILKDSNLSFQIVTERRDPLIGKWNISFAYWTASHYLSVDIDLVACIDADIVLQEKYFETLANRFEEDLNLGLVGGISLPYGFPQHSFPLPKSFEGKVVWGVNRVYRYQCWLDLNRTVDLRLLPNWEGGHDVLVALRGWKMMRVNDAVSWMLRPANPDRGLFKGLADRTYRYPVWWVLYKVLRTVDYRRFVGYACMTLWGSRAFPFRDIYRQAVISELRNHVYRLLSPD